MWIFCYKVAVGGGQFPPLFFIWCFKVFLWNSNILQLYIKCSGDWAPSLQGHIRLYINLNLCRHDFVFPWPVKIAVNSGVIGISNFSLCSTVGKNDLHSAPLSVLSHCVCHFVIPFFFLVQCQLLLLASYCVVYLVHRHTGLLLWRVCLPDHVHMYVLYIQVLTSVCSMHICTYVWM